MNKNLYVIMIASLMMAYSAFGVAQDNSGAAVSGPQAHGRHHGPPPMDAATKAAYDACLIEKNLTQPTGRPSEAFLSAMGECLKSKNVSMPAPPSRGDGQQGHFQPSQEFEDQSS